MRVDNRYWVIISTESGDVVAKMQTPNGYNVPESVADYDGFAAESVSDISTLTDKTIDWSRLSEKEKERLRQVYPRD